MSKRATHALRVELGATWRELPEFPNPRAGHSTTIAGNSVYLVGGRGDGDTYYNDTICFNLRTEQWNVVSERSSFQPRAHHSATLIENEIWIIGGSDQRDVYQDVHVLNLKSLVWRNETPNVHGNDILLRRTAHRAVQHPTVPRAILIHGGVFKADNSKETEFKGTLTQVTNNRGRLEVKEVRASGVSPHPRGYHTFCCIQQRCFVIGGRAGSNRLIEKQDLIGVYDPGGNRWENVLCSGTPPPHARSSEAFAAVEGATGDGCVVMHGGAAARRSNKLHDIHFLYVNPQGSERDGTVRIQWLEGNLLPSTGGRAAGMAPLVLAAGRAAHTLSFSSSCKSLMLIGGYGGQPGEERMYHRDAYMLTTPVPLLEIVRSAVGVDNVPHGAGAMSKGNARGQRAAQEMKADDVELGGGWKSAKRQRQSSPPDVGRAASGARKKVPLNVQPLTSSAPAPMPTATPQMAGALAAQARRLLEQPIGAATAASPAAPPRGPSIAPWDAPGLAAGAEAGSSDHTSSSSAMQTLQITKLKLQVERLEHKLQEKSDLAATKDQMWAAAVEQGKLDKGELEALKGALSKAEDKAGQAAASTASLSQQVEASRQQATRAEQGQRQALQDLAKTEEERNALEAGLASVRGDADNLRAQIRQ
ncbi:hypothetical protein CYMTET_7546, partial [Cymbomonas tetramitiformis]